MVGQPPRALTMASKHLQSWPGIYPSFPSNYEVCMFKTAESLGLRFYKCFLFYINVFSELNEDYIFCWQERAIRKTEAEAVSSPLGFSNWAWQMNGHGVVTPVPLFSTAASSGFSSTKPLFSGSLHPLNITQNNKLFVPSPANDTSSLYHDLKN